MTDTDDTGALTLGDQGRPVPIPWRLARGNFVNIYWVNWQDRHRETQGQIVEVRDGLVRIHRSPSSEAGGQAIDITRITGVDVIVEGDAGREIRRRVWELTKQAAGCINSKTAWDRAGFFAAWDMICEIMPELREPH